MTFTEVTALLQQYEELARQQGAAAMELLRPGLTSDELDAVEARYGFTLPEDVRAVWSWHDGSEFPAMPTAPSRVGASWDFRDIEQSIDEAQRRLDIQNSAGADRYMFSRWVTFSFGSVSDVIESSNRHMPDCYVLIHDPSQSVLNSPIVTVAEKLRWFIWAIENGVWTVDERGDWSVRRDRFPKNAMKDVL